MPVKPLPLNADLEHLKYQARDLLRQHAALDISSAQRLREFHPRFHKVTDEEIFAARLRLGDAQLTIARERGFASWVRLKRHIEKPTPADHLARPHHERIQNPLFRQAVDHVDSGNVSELRALLERNPQLIRERVLFEGGNYFRNPTPLEFIAENPIRHGVLPPNIVEVATVLLDAGPEQASVDATLLLVATGRVPRECNVQRALIDTLCRYGANPNPAAGAAALHGEFEAVHALIERGARLDLPLLAALGRTNEFLQALPRSNAEERHLALALSAQYGRLEIARALLDAGESPNRYNPAGAHAHSTPLHQAALAGHTELVRLFLERGARTDIRDLLWNGTAEGWARHGGERETEQILREAAQPSSTENSASLE